LGSQGLKKRLSTKIVWGARSVGFLRAYGRLRSCFVKRKIAIVQYHRIDEVTNFPFSLTPVTPKAFEREMRYLRRRYHIISLDELSLALDDINTLSPNTAVVTVDDGYRDVYVHAYPVLKKYSVPATVFLTTGHIGTRNLFWWDKIGYVIWHTKLKNIEVDGLDVFQLNSANERQRVTSTVIRSFKQMSTEKRNESIEKLVQQSGVDIPPDIGKELILSWDEIREMNKNGVSFGAHTINHPILTKVPLEGAKREILGSKQHIEKELNQAVTTFCYPNGEPGDYNNEIEEILKSNGFRCAVTSVPEAFVSPRTQRYELPRITGASSYDIFELLISGLYLDLVGRWGRLRR
jgi:peptidoglycan/xylan/chitin deacetylase (PgdA/CDA1 family)